MDKFKIGEIAISIKTGEEVEVLSGLVYTMAMNINTGLEKIILAHRVTDMRPDFLPSRGMVCRPENLRKKHPPTQDITKTRAQDRPIVFGDLIAKLNKELV